jgi:tubulin---tyrosine ligase
MLYAIIDYPDSYVQPLIVNAIKSQLQGLDLKLISSVQQLPLPSSPLLQITAYESLDFEHALGHPKSSLTCAYVIRKALIRKHYLSNTIFTWLSKHSDSLLRRHYKASVNFELDYAEFLDEALVDAWDLKESMSRNERLKDNDEKKEWWILKPGMSDGGNGIRLFSSMQQLQSIFEDWEGDEDSDLHDEDAQEDKTQLSGEGKELTLTLSNGIMTSQLRHFIAQPYIDPPLLLPSRGNRKFHLRVYVLAVGALKVYVFKEILALFAAKSYQCPAQLQDGGKIDLASHLTNTCLQDGPVREESVVRFWDLEETSLDHDWTEKVFRQICDVSAEIFEAAAREQMVHFQTLPNAFEVFGVDFLVDAGCNVWLLELNAYPDFKQTGQHLQDRVVSRLLHEVVKVAVRPFFNDKGGGSSCQGSEEMVPVLDIDLGRR